MEYDHFPQGVKTIAKPLPRLVIAGTHSGVGKTTITTAILAALQRRGSGVQPFKVGPDFIDPGYHTLAAGRISRNLDGWMIPHDRLQVLFQKAMDGAEVALIEGVMGLFDGFSGQDEAGSTAQLAKLLDCPVVLILDVGSMARSAAAVLKGFMTLDPDLTIAGVILNRVGSPRHREMVEAAIAQNCGIPVLGAIPKKIPVTMPERHLGLVPVVEREEAVRESLGALAQIVEENLDLDGLLALARQAPPWQELPEPPPLEGGSPVNLAIARDEAFSFYYQDGLEILESLGARLVPFSPLHDRELPEGIDGLYIGGGYPELFLERLAGNTAMLESIRRQVAAGLPVYAECGGMMYLSEAVEDFEGKSYELVGVVPGVCRMKKRLAGMGYVEVIPLGDNLLAPEGHPLRGHEFHYSERVAPPGSPGAFRFAKRLGGPAWDDGYLGENVTASYLHYHFASDPLAAQRFLDRLRRYREGRR